MSSAQEQVDPPPEPAEAPPELQAPAAPGADEGDAPAEDSDAAEDALPQPRWWEEFRDFYLTFDRRTLGMTRLLLGFFLIFDQIRRTDDWWKMFSNEGV